MDEPLKPLDALTEKEKRDIARQVDKEQRDSDAEREISAFDFDVFPLERAKRLLYEKGWIAGAYHARVMAGSNTGAPIVNRGAAPEPRATITEAEAECHRHHFKTHGCSATAEEVSAWLACARASGWVKP